MPDLLSQADIDAALRDSVPQWSQDGNAIVRTVKAPSFPEGIKLVDSVAEVAEEMNHHPDIDIRYNKITFSLSTHALGGLTNNDFALAADIDRLLPS